MTKKQILYFILSLAFIGLNLSVLFVALWGNNPGLTLSLLGLSFVVGVILYFLLRFHKKEKTYRASLKEPKTDDQTKPDQD